MFRRPLPLLFAPLLILACRGPESKAPAEGATGGVLAAESPAAQVQEAAAARVAEPGPVAPQQPESRPALRILPAAAAQAIAAAERDAGADPAALTAARESLRDASLRFKRLEPTAQQGAFGQALRREIRELQAEVERLRAALDG